MGLYRRFWWMWMLALMSFSGVTPATTIRSVSLDQMTVQARLIFEGRVIGRQVLTDPVSGRPFTRITFAVLDVIKGDDPGAKLQLDFLGGRDQSLEYQVAEMVYPEINESGVYFVENPRQRLVNPLYGWTQGHFVSFQDASGVRRIRTATGQVVTRLDFEAEAPTGKISRSVAEGVITRALTQMRPQPAMTVDAFKQGVRRYLETQP